MIEYDTYTPSISDKLAQACGGDLNIAGLAARLASLISKRDVAHVSLQYLLDTYGWNKNTLKARITVLQEMEIIEVQFGTHRGVPSVWRKGSKFDTFFGNERGQKTVEKGSKIAPFDYKNKSYNNKLTKKIDRYNKRAYARTNQPNKFIFMEEFDQFWRAFFFGSYAKYEAEQTTLRERCMKVFALMPEDKRAHLLRDIKAGKRFDSSHFVLWYLQNYEPGYRKGTRLSHDQYYAHFGDDAVRDGWKFYKPDGYNKFIYEKI